MSGSWNLRLDYFFLTSAFLGLSSPSIEEEDRDTDVPSDIYSN